MQPSETEIVSIVCISSSEAKKSLLEELLVLFLDFCDSSWLKLMVVVMGDWVV